MSTNEKCDSIRRKWLFKDDRTPQTRAAVEAVSRGLGVSRVMAQLLVNRGYRDAESARRFLCMESELLCDPFSFADIEPALSRIRKAVESREKIAIYGDYDVEGVTAVCTFYLYLASKGANVTYYIPNRAGEGYGVSRSAIDTLRADGVSLVITVDTGITANEEIAYAATLGVDFVVTDHHECRPELPPAVAVVDPHRPDCPYPFKDLAGVGVVFKIICAYEEYTTGRARRECVALLCQRYADLVAIGTIADVMPIRGENKLIVSYGLGRMEKERRPGLAALMAAASPKSESAPRRARAEQKITSGYIGYTIAPRLNAAGRIRSASLAVELFLTQDADRARALAEELCEANKERQNEENSIMKEAYARIDAEHDFDRYPVIVLEADHWHHGVIGIVSSRITERYGLPSILVSFEGCDGEPSPDDVGKGSGRSIKGMNLVEALVYCEELLVKHGGHELAAGLSVTRGNLDAFRERINEYARENLSEEAMIPTLEADCLLSMRDINIDLAVELRRLEPFGVANPVPTFAIEDLVVEEIVPVSGGKHTRLVLREGDVHMTAMYFSHPTDGVDLYPGERVDVLFCLDINEWGGRRTVQLVAKDVRSALGDVNAAKARFAEIFAGASFYADEDVVPNREDFAAVYTVVRRFVRGGTDTMSMRRMASLLHTDGRDVGYIKLKMIFRIFQELNLLGIEEVEEDVFRFRLQFHSTKTDLEKSNLLRLLRSRVRMR